MDSQLLANQGHPKPVPTFLTFMWCLIEQFIYDAVKLSCVETFFVLLPMKLDGIIKQMSWMQIHIPIIVFQAMGIFERLIWLFLRLGYRQKQELEMSNVWIVLTMLAHGHLMWFHIGLALALDSGKAVTNAELLPLTMALAFFSLGFCMAGFRYRYSCVNLCHYLQLPAAVGAMISVILLSSSLSSIQAKSLLVIAIPIILAQVVILLLPIMAWLSYKAAVVDASRSFSYGHFKEQAICLACCFFPGLVIFQVLLYMKLTGRTDIPFYQVFIPLWIATLMIPIGMTTFYYHEYAGTYGPKPSETDAA